MKFLVTGGAGFIGSHLTDALINQGNEVIVIDDLSAGKKENLNPKAEFHQLDIRNHEAIKPLFNGIDGVFHLAAIPRVPVSVKDPIGTNSVNVGGTVSVFTAAKEAKVKRVIFISSSSVYGNQTKLPLREDMEPSPVSPYGLQKLIGELYAKLFYKLYGLPIVSLRYFNVYGSRIDWSSDYSLVLGKFLKQKFLKKPLTIYGDGEQTRGFTYVSDVADATIAAYFASSLKGDEVINIGSETSHSVNCLAKLIGGPTVYLEPRVGDVKHTQADISLAKKHLGWRPKVGIEEGVESVKKYFSETFQN